MKITREYMIQLMGRYKSYNMMPFVVEVCGTPNSGKTSAIHAFEKILRRSGIKYKVIYEVATRCKIKKKLSPDFDLWTLNETIKQLVEAYSEEYDIIICERGLLDAICWYNLYLQDGLMTEKEYKILLNYILLDRFISHIKCCYVMKCSVETSIKRENLFGMLDRTGTIINNIVLGKYNSALENACILYSKYFEKTIELDTSDLPQTNINKTFVSSIIDCIENLSAEKKQQ